MRRMLLLNLNSCKEADEGTGGKGGGGKWRGLAVMGFRVFLLVCLLFLADAQKWPVSGDCQPCQCYYKTTVFGRLRTVNCSHKGLKAIPSNLPQDLMSLDLSRNSLDPDQLRLSLCQFKSLQTLTLSFTDLTTLSDILKECSSVLELNLTGNRLNQVDSTTFQGLDSLRRLLGLEVETVVTNDVFRELTNLKDLDLIFHGKWLPAGLFDGMVIQSLNLVLTQASHLPQGVFDFGGRTLNTLQLLGDRVTTLSEDLLDGLSVLRKLYLTVPWLDRLDRRFFHGQQGRGASGPVNLQEVEILGVKTLPPTLFNRLANLETLQLKEIGSFPRTAFLAEVVNLRLLDIAGSNLTRIPASWFKELYSLTTLRLSEDQLEELHEDAFQGLLNLNELDLSNNKLETISGKMLEPVSRTLETLTLSGNRLTEISSDCMSGLRSLRFLDVSGNSLTNIYANSFMGIPFLSVLLLRNNRLTSLPKDLFKDQIQLQTLSVAENYLVEFPEAVLKLQYSLVDLDLSSNQIRQVPAFQFCKFLYLEQVDLTKNFLHCDCRLLAFQRCQNITALGQCKSPKKYENQSIGDIKIPESCEILEQPKEVSPSPSTVSKGPQPHPEQDKGDLNTNNKSENQEKSNSTVIRDLFPDFPGSDGSNTSSPGGLETTPLPTSSAGLSGEEAADGDQGKSSEGGDAGFQNKSDKAGKEQEGTESDTEKSTPLPGSGVSNKTTDASTNKDEMMADASAQGPEDQEKGDGSQNKTEDTDSERLDAGNSSFSADKNSTSTPEKEKTETKQKPCFIPLLPCGVKLGFNSDNLTDELSEHEQHVATGGAGVTAGGETSGQGGSTPRNSEKVAFNFTISALAALVVFGFALMTVFCIRRCQRKGSYPVNNPDIEDTPMDSMESDKPCGASGQGDLNIESLDKPPRQK